VRAAPASTLPLSERQRATNSSEGHPGCGSLRDASLRRDPQSVALTAGILSFLMAGSATS
jgi:hypothetical protein